MGEDLAIPVLSLAVGPLAWRMRRGVELALAGLPRERRSGRGVTTAGVELEERVGAGDCALVKRKAEGLKMSLEGVDRLVPLERLAKSRGSTFSESSTSRSSALRFPPAAGLLLLLLLFETDIRALLVQGPTDSALQSTRGAPL
jgi:hypothetical protein